MSRTITADEWRKRWAQLQETANLLRYVPTWQATVTALRLQDKDPRTYANEESYNRLRATALEVLAERGIHVEEIS